LTLDRRRKKAILRGPVRAGVMAVAALGATGCEDFVDGLLSVSPPGQVTAEALEDPANARLLVDGVVADFECALAFYILSSALLGDELVDTHPFVGAWDYERRGFANGEGAYAGLTCDAVGALFGVYKPVSTARWSADHALRRLQEWSDARVPDRQELIATAAAYSGYSHILLGEGFCSAAVDGGPELTPAQIFELARERFTTAIEVGQAAGLTDIVHMARVGRARAALSLGLGAEARADAVAVPDDFVYYARYSMASDRSGNHVFRRVNRFRWATVGPLYRSLEWEGVPDPRVALIETGEPADPFHDAWLQTKYGTEGAPIPMASWREARLIEAEVEGGARAVEIFDALHEAAGLPPFSSTDEEEIREHLILTRARELFLEGHHIHDIIRFDLPLNPAPGTAFPKGGVYGTTTCLPLPQVERVNNPSIP
jgi:starch-binding outer membrane protein, SusD/RagB family